MADVPPAVSALFTPDVLARLAKVRRPPPSKHDGAGDLIRRRHLLFSGEDLSTSWERLHRAAWWSYIVHADSRGSIDDDVRKRLTGNADDNFRGALAECMCQWYFATHLHRELQRHPAVDGGPDFVGDGGLHVEVKAPHKPRTGSTFSGDDSKLIRQCVEAAGKQFDSGHVNLVVLAPRLRMPVCQERDQLVKALIGQPMWGYTIAIDPDDEPEPVTEEFMQDGKLAKLYRGKVEGELFTNLTRISAVATIETEIPFVDRDLVFRHEVRVVHNPFAVKPLPPEIFHGHPQFSVYDEGMAWSDRVDAIRTGKPVAND